MISRVDSSRSHLQVATGVYRLGEGSVNSSSLRRRNRLIEHRIPFFMEPKTRS
jgi:hypothetical protein